MSTKDGDNKGGGGIPVFDWFAEPIKQSVNSVFKDVNEGVEALDIFRRFRRAQFQIVKIQVSTIKILGMPAPVPLVNIYSAAHLSTTISRRLFQAEWLNAKSKDDLQHVIGASKKKSIVLGEDFVETNRRAVILGGPGSGKTTFIKHLALAYVDPSVFKSTKLKTTALPIFVSLPHFSKSGQVLFDFILKPLTERTNQYARGYLERSLDKGIASVLLDSLDEVLVSDRKSVLGEIEKFAQRFPNARLVVTCRTADYEGSLDTFSEAELMRLSQSAVQKIVMAWFRDDQEKGNQLCRQLRTDRGVSSLTETPLLLSLLCIQFKHDLTLPKRKAELYRRCVDTLLRDWDASRRFRRQSAYEDLTDERKERLFDHIAGKFFLDGIRLAFKKTSLIDVIGAYIPRYAIDKKHSEGILQEIEKHHGILEQIATDMYAFSHTSFQEFFVARDLLARRLESDYVKKHMDDDNWSSVIEFMAAMHENPEPMLRILVEKSNMATYKNYPAMARRTKILWLIYRCMVAGACVDPKFAKEVYEHLANSQLEMAKIYRGGGVYPIAVLHHDGVRHAYYFFNRRPTLSDALQPYRMLANEMIVFPIEAYAQVVLDNLDAIVSKLDDTVPYAKIALALCLVIPIAPCRPKEVENILQGFKESQRRRESGTSNGPLISFIDESLEVLRAKYGTTP